MSEPRRKLPCPFCVGAAGEDSCWICEGEGWTPPDSALNRGAQLS